MFALPCIYPRYLKIIFLPHPPKTVDKKRSFFFCTVSASLEIFSSKVQYIQCASDLLNPFFFSLQHISVHSYWHLAMYTSAFIDFPARIHPKKKISLNG